MKFMEVIVLLLAGISPFAGKFSLVCDDSRILERHPVEIVKVHISPLI